jgi:hypothetical protein
VPECRCRGVQLEYCFDRLWSAKLEQVYELLVPNQCRRTGASCTAGGSSHEDSGDLRAGVLGAAEAGPYDRQSDGLAEGLRFEPRLRRTG